MGLDRQTSPSSSLLPGRDACPQGVCSRPLGEGCDQEGEVSQVSGASVLRSQTGLRQAASHSRPVSSEFVHSVRQVPDAHYFAGTDPTSPWGRHYLHRSYRRLLAYPNCPSPYPLPWLQAGKSGVHLQSYALRTQHSAQGVHQVGGHSGPGTPPSGHSGGGVSGRLDNLGVLEGGVPSGSQDSSGLPENTGLQSQLPKVSADSGVEVRVAGSPLGPGLSYPLASSSKVQTDRQTDEVFPQASKGHAERSGASPRLPPVCVRYGSCAQSQVEGHQQSLAQPSQFSSQRQEALSPSPSSQTSSPLEDGTEPFQVRPFTLPSSIPRDPYGRVSDWLGRSCPLPVSTRDLVSSPQPPPHQCVGSDGGFVVPQETQTQEELSYSSSSRQPSCCSLSESTGFQVAADQSCHDSHLLPCQEKILASFSDSPRGSPERHSGLSLQVGSSGVGMVARPNLLSLDSDESTRSTGRSVRDGVQSQTPLLRSPQPGPSGLCHGRSVSGLEPMGKDISVSSGQLSHEGPSQAQVLQRYGRPSGSQLAEEQLVSSSLGTQTSSISNSVTGTVSGSANQDCISFILANEQLDFMGFLKFAAKRRFDIDPVNMDFTEANKSDSTIRQYDAAFRKLSSFLRSTKPKEMSINLALSFFRSLHDSGLAASTVTSTKSALAKVFYYGFDMRLNDVCFASIAHSCAKLRPTARPEMLSWSLNKVLQLASSIANDSCSYQQLFRKTLFLLALASGARLSELAALSRDKGFVTFLPSGEVSLSPHPKFLAKNEDPQNRWSPWKIIPLPQDPSLCPVEVLRAYLQRTDSWRSGSLFKREKGGTITINGIRQQILYFIKAADPDSVPTAHQVRAIATSVNFFQYMDFQALSHYTSWKSSRVFMHHYFKNIDALKFYAVVAGKVVVPSQDDSISDDD